MNPLLCRNRKAGNSPHELVPIAPELGVEGVRVGVEFQNVAFSELKVQDASQVRDFDIGFYREDRLNPEEIERHVRSWLSEKLMMPRRENLWIGKNKEIDPNYLRMMKRAIEHARSTGDERAVRRYRYELEGVASLVDLMVETGKDGSPIPMFVTASDPGDFYVDSEGRKKSNTFVAVLETSEKGGWWYSMFTLPTRFIGLEKHWNILRRLGNVQKTERILGKMMEELTPEKMVAFPVILDEFIQSSSLDLLALELGYRSWEEVEKKASDQLALENDSLAIERREMMIGDFVKRVIVSVREGASKEAKDALVNAMADTFAMEQGGEYLHKNGEFIFREINRMIGVALADKLGVFTTTQSPDYEVREYWLTQGFNIDEVWEQRAWIMKVYQTNPLAQEARATGCGGAGISLGGQGIESWFGVSYQGQQEMSYSGFELIQNGSVFDATDSDTKSTSTGKYKEYYNYRHGVCKGPCGKEKPYVAYPKNSEIKCAGWCSDCEK